MRRRRPGAPASNTCLHRSTSRVARIELEFEIAWATPPDEVSIEELTWDRQPCERIRGRVGQLCVWRRCGQPLLPRMTVWCPTRTTRSHSCGRWAREAVDDRCLGLGPDGYAQRPEGACRAQKTRAAQKTASGAWRRLEAITPDTAREALCFSGVFDPWRVRVQQVCRCIVRSLRDRFSQAAGASHCSDAERARVDVLCLPTRGPPQRRGAEEQLGHARGGLERPHDDP